MALDAEDLARLRRIESDLASADPALATRFRSWQPPADRRAPVPGWSALPRWVLEVFLVGFAGWVLPVALSALVVAGIAACRLWHHAADRRRPPRRPGTGGNRWGRPPSRRRRS